MPRAVVIVARMSAVPPAAPAPAWIRGLSARTLGVLAVVGLVVAFSLSSTLVKRAETAGVLVAFWRLAVVSLAWNVVLWSTGRRITLRDVRAVWIPGVFFGLNLAVFFAGATHNSVANAAHPVVAVARRHGDRAPPHVIVEERSA